MAFSPTANAFQTAFTVAAPTFELGARTRCHGEALTLRVVKNLAAPIVMNPTAIQLYLDRLRYDADTISGFSTYQTRFRFEGMPCVSCASPQASTSWRPRVVSVSHQSRSRTDGVGAAALLR